jgi:hypothetical protein
MAQDAPFATFETTPGGKLQGAVRRGRGPSSSIILWGKSAEHLLIAAAKAGKEGAPLRFV